MTSRVRFSVLRRADFLALDLEMVNMRLAGSPARLVRDDLAEDAFLVVHFPAQHIAEEALSGFSVADPIQRLRARLSGPSRLVFAIPPGTNEVLCTLATLLDWTQFTPVAMPAALPPGTRPDDLPAGERPAPAAPEPLTTAIEAPYRVTLSPDASERWRHELDASPGPTGVVPLWHTDLRPGGDRSVASVRAIWNRDREGTGPPPAYTTSLTEGDRNDIVTLSADFSIAGYTPVAIDAGTLRLTSLGAWLDLKGIWENLPADLDISLEAWVHRATMGRDQAVTVVRRGYLYPYGHRASMVTVTRREFVQWPGQSLVEAELVQQTFIVPRERVRDYTTLPEPDRRGTPFQRVEIVSPVSPPIHRFEERVPAFWPISAEDDEDLRFDLIGTDQDGARHAFTTPLLFVHHPPDDPNGVEQIYDQGADSRRVTPFGDQVVAFAKSGEPGDATLPAQSITHAGGWTGDADSPFFPAMRQAAVKIRALEHLTQGGPVPTIAFNDVYRDVGLSAGNPNDVFADLVGAPPTVELRADQAGGLAVPRIEPRVLSRRLGPVGGDPLQIAQGHFPDPSAALTQALGPSKLLGVISLKDLVPSNPPDPMTQVPALTSVERDGRLESTLHQHAALKGDGALDLRTTLSAPLAAQGAADPTYATHGTITNLSLTLIPDVAEVMTLHFSRLDFASGSSQKPTFNAVVRDVEFTGPLSFLRELQKILGSSLATPPGVDVSPAGVRVTYTLAIPTVAVGIFSLQNVAISAALELPFAAPSTKAPVRLRFAFCERHRPFLLTVALFGGGGFVALELTPEGIALLEASLEFGASVALNLGLASGRVEVMAGIYFRLELAPTATDRGVSLTGYFRCGGSLEVLSLIRISAEFYLGLTWKAPKAWGLARLTVEIEIAFFSKSVSLEVERQFSGTSNDPPFSKLVNPDEWAEYLAAFA